LATQLLELGVPLVLAFNMSDLAEDRGFSMDRPLLSSLLGVPIVRTVADKGDGIDDLLGAVVAAASDPKATVEAQRRPEYGTELEPHVRQLTTLLTEACGPGGHARWFAIKLLEGDRETTKRLSEQCPGQADRLVAEARRLRRHIRRVCGGPTEIVFADRRYGFISGACAEAVKQSAETRGTRSDRIDRVVTNRIFGLPLFLLLTLLVFQLTFSVGNPLSDVLAAGKDHLAGLVGQLWPSGSDSLFRSLLVNGVIEGVGAVVVFVPLI
ncbi:unnamed protein product, partial [marine sediment metagenome]